jgi:hypothetical protein
MFALWAVVLWGTLLDLVAVWMLATTGPRVAWEHLQGLSAINVLLGVLAIFVWLTVGWTLTLGSKGDG